MHSPTTSPPRGKGPTEGRRAAALARRVLGLDVLAWQGDVLDGGLERVAVPGPANRATRRALRWRWRTVVVTVARQNGKSALLRALVAHRLIRGQTVGALSSYPRGRPAKQCSTRSPMRSRARASRDLFGAHATRANGSEALTLRATGGRLVMPSSSSERGGHGYSLDLAIVDEAWALKDYRVPAAHHPDPDRPARPAIVGGVDGGHGRVALVSRARRGRP